MHGLGVVDYVEAEWCSDLRLWRNTITIATNRDATLGYSLSRQTSQRDLTLLVHSFGTEVNNIHNNNVGLQLFIWLSIMKKKKVFNNLKNYVSNIMKNLVERRVNPTPARPAASLTPPDQTSLSLLSQPLSIHPPQLGLEDSRPSLTCGIAPSYNTSTLRPSPITISSTLPSYTLEFTNFISNLLRTISTTKNAFLELMGIRQI